ncbi:MAG: hypothetical protein ALECFALPRED_006729 [Alectoria fallacina]|uniref:NAD-dependent epimerase/dehydratase domain-containing protein n=1 Tax=Alectoria fallacina TaxID=1903189 RepID=A0A8H3G5J3_9LECA|nr:MAG: hypothetical protein ALECFALPRED_006729 [Alectoria fallacina]
MASQTLILLTGATGFIGFRTLVFALKAGYSVRCALRDPKKEPTILSNPAIKSLQLAPNILTFTTVPDLTVHCAYTEAMRDVTHVIHIASPLPRANPTGYLTPEKSFIQPALRGALEVLEAAKHAGTVRRVVLTSSVTALIPSPVWMGIDPSTETYGPASRIPTPKGPFPDNGKAYGASKTAQLNAVEEWTRKETPRFSVVTIHPSWVLGRNDLASTVEELWAGTNRFPLDIAIGKKFDEPRTGACVHVDDVARAHVLALGENVQGNRSFVLNSPMRWEKVGGVLERDFGNGVEKGLLSTEGEQRTAPIDIRGEETEIVLGFRYLSFEAQVKSVVGQYLELKGLEGET